MERKNAWLSYSEEERAKLNQVCDDYKAYLSIAKTERECVTEAVRLAEAKGYRRMEDVMKAGETLKEGDRVYRICMNKTLVLFQIGSEPIENGMNILGAHIDSPRLDLKQNPLYEDTDMVLLDTHYYGGVKKYQWVAMPLALHGVVAKKDGTSINVVIGEDPEDPVLCISDLLPHLAADQMQKKASEIIDGEALDVLFGSEPAADADEKEKELVKKNILALLKAKYDMEEEDFISAELEIVPAGAARDCGLDRSMVIGYGQDDRICAYTSLAAQLDMGPENVLLYAFWSTRKRLEASVRPACILVSSRIR